jgi:hypothetical protein
MISIISRENVEFSKKEKEKIWVFIYLFIFCLFDILFYVSYPVCNVVHTLSLSALLESFSAASG